jgi:hypothetical protein
MHTESHPTAPRSGTQVQLNLESQPTSNCIQPPSVAPSKSSRPLSRTRVQYGRASRLDVASDGAPEAPNTPHHHPLRCTLRCNPELHPTTILGRRGGSKTPPRRPSCLAPESNSG